jgi:hypothetical protein
MSSHTPLPLGQDAQIGTPLYTRAYTGTGDESATFGITAGEKHKLYKGYSRTGDIGLIHRQHPKISPILLSGHLQIALGIRGFRREHHMARTWSLT